MAKHAPRRAQLVFTETAEQQLARVTPDAYRRLDRVLEAIAVNPVVGALMERAPTLREYTAETAASSTTPPSWASSLSRIRIPELQFRHLQRREAHPAR
ncbi:hypothetical protein [Streptacidiphilus sp. EB103A]|uniref:hypothetical protein n=1 Tax=Streptacidiphilus sp. EB103A TaxID=3156275 RepID=UPI0035193DD1